MLEYQHLTTNTCMHVDPSHVLHTNMILGDLNAETVGGIHNDMWFCTGVLTTKLAYDMIIRVVLPQICYGCLVVFNFKLTYNIPL